jgi:hypothetical protein
MKDSKEDSYALIRMTVTEALNKPNQQYKNISQSSYSHKLGSMTLLEVVLTFSLHVQVSVSIRLSGGNILVITQAGKCLETCEITLPIVITAE